MLNDVQCWNCTATIGEGLFCNHCQVIQPPKNTDYFTLFSLPAQYAQDVSAIERAYFSLQRQLHPDRFASKPERMRKYSLEHSMRANEAYEILKNPMKRAQYLLHLAGIEINGEKDTIKPSHTLLMEVMELREALSEVSTAHALNMLLSDIHTRVEDTQSQLNAAFEAGALQEAAGLALRLNYLHKLAHDAKIAARSMNGTTA